MVNTITGVPNEPPRRTGVFSRAPLIPRDLRVPEKKDVLQLTSGKGVTSNQALNLVRERAYEQLRGIVSQARADLGIPETAELDTSPEATADRIVNFALQFFSKYAENNKLQNDEAGRGQFAEFIGAAIGKGIDEARGILQGLQVLNPQVGAQIDETAGIIQQRLDDFILNGL